MPDPTGPLLDDVFQQIEALLGPIRAGRPNDITLDLELLGVDADRGCTRAIRYPRRIVCDVCEGSGAAPDTPVTTCEACQGKGSVDRAVAAFRIAAACERCGGRGRIAERACAACRSGLRTIDAALTVTVPPAVETGQMLRLRGRGHEAHNIASGDCYVRLNVVDRAIAVRDADDLRIELPVDRALARRGGRLRVPGREGEMDVTLPPRSREGDEIVLEGLGYARSAASAEGRAYRTGLVHGNAIVRVRLRPGVLARVSQPTAVAIGILVTGAVLAGILVNC